MLSFADIERRLLAALAEPVETAEVRKCALLDVLRRLGRAGVKHALAGDLGLSLRSMSHGSMRLELAIVTVWPRCHGTWSRLVLCGLRWGV